MKTADRENPNHGAALPRNRAHGAVGQNRSRPIKWAEKQEKFQPQEMCFFLTSTFIELPGTNLLDEWIGDLPLIAEVVASQLAKITAQRAGNTSRTGSNGNPHPPGC
jgi:hypothetical protein